MAVYNSECTLVYLQRGGGNDCSQNDVTGIAHCTDRAAQQRLVVEYHQLVGREGVHLQRGHQFATEFASGQHRRFHSTDVEIAADHLHVLRTSYTSHEVHNSRKAIMKK